LICATKPIEVINWDGDEYDYFPHLYCHFFGKDDQPYERLIFCKEVDMGNGHKYYSEVGTLEHIQENSKKQGIEYFG